MSKVGVVVSERCGSERVRVWRMLRDVRDGRVRGDGLGSEELREEVESKVEGVGDRSASGCDTTPRPSGKFPILEDDCECGARVLCRRRGSENVVFERAGIHEDGMTYEDGGSGIEGNRGQPVPNAEFGGTGGPRPEGRESTQQGIHSCRLTTGGRDRAAGRPPPTGCFPTKPSLNGPVTDVAVTDGTVTDGAAAHGTFPKFPFARGGSGSRQEFPPVEQVAHSLAGLGEGT